MAWDCKNRFWPGTRNYMMTGRTNPKPGVYTASLTANGITAAEKAHLINCVKTWPGGAPLGAPVVNGTAADIERAEVSG